MLKNSPAIVAVLLSCLELTSPIVVRPQPQPNLEDLYLEPRGVLPPWTALLPLPLPLPPPTPRLPELPPFFADVGHLQSSRGNEEDKWKEAAENVTVQPGQEARLHCRVNDLRDKTVSWIRHHQHNFELITFGHLTYTSEERYSLSYVQPNDWQLVIRGAQYADAGTYECQVSLHPPISRCTHLIVQAPVVEILDVSGSSVSERFYRSGSSMELRCRASAQGLQPMQLAWLHGDQLLNQDTRRGGISVKTEVVFGGLESLLRISRTRKSDSGLYTCLLGDSRAEINVHVLSDEYAGAMQYGKGTKLNISFFLEFLSISLHFILSFIIMEYIS